MTDEKLVQNGTVKESQNDKTGCRAPVGKIARLPADIREEINTRFYDGKRGLDILSWLNELTPVKEILAALFDAKPITRQNLSHWHRTSYQRWLRRRENVGSLKDLGQYAAHLTQAGEGHLAPAAAAMASGKILEFLETADPGHANPGDLVKCAGAASNLLKMEQNYARIKIANMRLRQRDMALLLTRDKQQRDTVAIARRVLGDARAKAIEDSSWSNAEKIEALGIHLYGHLWEPRPVPAGTPVDAPGEAGLPRRSFSKGGSKPVQPNPT